MTITLNPEHLAEATDLGTEHEFDEPEDKKTDIQQLAALLAQAYVALPLFP